MIGLDLIAAHMVGDYILQTSEEASHKLDDWLIRAEHVTSYCIPFIPVGLIHSNFETTIIFLALLWVTHFITDSRRWASDEHWKPLPILVDQSIHLATLAILARLLV